MLAVVPVSIQQKARETPHETISGLESHRGSRSVGATTDGCGRKDHLSHRGKDQWVATMSEFLRSGAINEAPFNIIAASMYASLAQKAAAGQKKVPNQGTFTDVNIVSTLLPYCDAMFIDNGCRALLQDIPKEHKLPFPCKVFSPNTGADFIRYLMEIRDSASPEALEINRRGVRPRPFEASKKHLWSGKAEAIGVRHEILTAKSLYTKQDSVIPGKLT
jgi:hypothetical protein